MNTPAIVPNRISTVLGAEDHATILAHLADIKARLSFLVGLDPDDKQELHKVGDKGRAFIQKAHVVAPKIAGYLPRAFSLDEMTRDVELMEALRPIVLEVATLAKKLDDTYALVSSEAYAAALIVYANGKDARGQEGLAAAVDDLAQRFARKSRKED